jgi:hypothetical protein
MTEQSFAGVRVVGGLLPADLLSRLVAARDVPGLTSGDYHLGSGESVREAANRSWSYLTAVWSSYQVALAQLPDTDRATTLTRDRWLQQLLGQLGYGRVPGTPAGGIVADAKAFPISHCWQHVPMHLLGWRTELDKKTPGLAGAAEAAPQSLVQECLNRAEEHLWAVLSNGRTLRVLRDSTSLVGSAYVEFDLETIFSGELFSDFLLLYTLCHESRFEKLDAEAGPESCWLERWRTDAIETGSRALEQLRDGVRKAIETLGTGFLHHRANSDLRESLAAGTLTREDYRQAMLRLVYRLLFLFVAEDRSALLDPDSTAQARSRYNDYFSTARLRMIARRRRGAGHGDLWRALNLVIDGLGSEQGRPELGLPGIGGLFEQGPLDFPSRHELSNQALLEAIRSLSLITERNSGKKRIVDYRNLGAEELGSVYESLLEYVPQHDPAARTFTLVQLPGNERRTTGSYYTPTSLIETLLDSALEPLLADAMKSDNPRAALLSLTVCDPACGSGHFLVAAARRIAKRVATVDTGDPEPPPETVRAALREVVSTCIYGVDLNPLAADLAKVSLWLEAMQPGRPLAFLDAQIKVGNALIGATPKLLADGIPDDAFKPIEGDDRTIARSLLIRSRSEQPTQGDLFAEAGIDTANQLLARQVREVLTGPALSLTDAHEQARRQRQFENSPELRHARMVADAWCAAFVQPKIPEAAAYITQGTLLALEQGSATAPTEVRDLVTDLATRYRFFHWHLEFPHVFPVPNMASSDTNDATGWDGGFSCILGNPPWDQVQLDPREFFAATHPEISEQPTMTARNLAITRLKNDDFPAWDSFRMAKRQLDGFKHFVHNSGRFPLSSYGRLNLYSLFAEHDRSLIDPAGRTGVIMPTGIATDSFNQYYFRDLIEAGSLVSLFDFENAKPLFDGVHRSFKFCLLTLTGRRNREPAANFAFFCHDTADLAKQDAQFTLTPKEIALLNPNTGTCPIFRSRRDAEITLEIYRRVPVFVREGHPDGNPWEVTFQLMFMMNTDSHKFRTRKNLENDDWHLVGNTFIRGNTRMLPLYEAKMIHHYDHRWATYEPDGTIRNVTPEEKQSPNFAAMPRYWVAETEVDSRLEGRWDKSWLLGFRDICRSTDERTTITSRFPLCAVGNNLPVALTSANSLLLQACLSTFVVDFCARLKVGGTHLNFFIIEQLPVLDPRTFDIPAPFDSGMTFGKWVEQRVLALDLDTSKPDGAAESWTRPAVRETLRCELDAAFFHLYGIISDDVDYIMDTFPIVRRKDEERFGEYRTKRRVLEIYDAMGQAIESGDPYRTIPTLPIGRGLPHEVQVVE